MEQTDDSGTPVDPATDYSALPVAHRSLFTCALQLSERLEAAGFRHCFVGDIVAFALGANILVGHSIIAVCDDELAAAGAFALSTGLVHKHTPNYTDFTREMAGFIFILISVLADPVSNPCRILLMPASFWHLDLDTCTVLVPRPRCRFPNKMDYLHGLIYAIAQRTRDGLVDSFTTHLNYQLSNAYHFFPPSLLPQLRPEDVLFLELYNKVLLPSARRKLCVEYDRIERGETTVEEARRRIPRKDLEIAKVKAKYDAMRATKAAAESSSQ